MSVKGRYAALALIAALVATGCGSASSAPGSTQRSDTKVAAPPEGGPNVDWDNPIQGHKIVSAAAARDILPFDVVEATFLGTPVSIYLTRPGPPDKIRVIAFVYDDPQYGRVVVEEHYPDVAPADYAAYERAVVDSTKDPNVHGSAQLVQLDGGETGLMTTNERSDTSMMVWLEDRGRHFEVIVRGPTMSSEQALAISNTISTTR